MRPTLILTSLVLTCNLSVSTLAADSGWQERVADALGRKGAEVDGGLYRVSLPRTDLKVRLDGIEIKPAFALGSWLTFKPMSDNTVMVMGDLVVTENEVNPVLKSLTETGIEITAIHNHLLRNEPFTMYMHVSGHGEPATLAAALRAGIEKTKTPPAAGAAPAASSSIDLDTNSIDQVLGYGGKVNGGVYQVSIPRATPVLDHGIEIPESMGSAIAINFQPTGNGKAAITGDFVLAADEVNPVLHALRANGIEITALHNHMLGDEPRLFFMHFWGNNDAGMLAQGLRSALDKVKVAHP